MIMGPQAKRANAITLSAAAGIRLAAVYCRQHNWTACEANLVESAIVPAATGPEDHHLLHAMLAAERHLVQADMHCRQGDAAQGLSQAGAALTAMQAARSSPDTAGLSSEHAILEATARAHLCLAECAAAAADTLTADRQCRQALDALQLPEAALQDATAAQCRPALLVGAILAVQAFLLADAPTSLAEQSAVAPCQADLLGCGSAITVQLPAAAKASRQSARGRGTGRRGAARRAQPSCSGPSVPHNKLQLLARAYALCHAAPLLARHAPTRTASSECAIIIIKL